MSALRDYVMSISKAYYEGNHSEHSHRTVFQNLIEEVLKSIDSSFNVLQETRLPEVYGRSRPDFIVFNKGFGGISTGNLLGAIETKNLDKSLYDKRFKSQIEKYSEHYPLLITNYLEYHLYIEGRLIDESGNLFYPFDAEVMWETLVDLLEKFVNYGYVSRDIFVLDS